MKTKLFLVLFIASKFIFANPFESTFAKVTESFYWGSSQNQQFDIRRAFVPEIGIKANNSESAWENLLVNPDPNPDLLIVNQSLNTNSVAAGSTFIAESAESNIGPVDAGANVISIYLSSDATLTPGENGDIFLGEIPIPIISANSISPVYGTDIQLPINTTPGDYYVFFFADGAQVIEESNELNNLATIQLTVLAAPVLGNDNPCDIGVPTLEVGTTCSFIQGTNVGATNSGIPNVNCDGPSNGDIWYKLIVPVSGKVTIETDAGTITDMGMAVYSGSCDALNFIDCFANGSSYSQWMPKAVLTGLTPGSTIWVRLWEFSNDYFGTFSICATTPAGDNFTIGTSSAPLIGGQTTGGGSFTYGQTATVISTPDLGYSFINWSEDGRIVSGSPSYSFIVSDNRTLVANFNLGNTYTISLTPEPTAGGSVSGGGTFSFGQTATVSAANNYGYEFICWIEDGHPVSYTPSYTFTVIGGRNLIAQFGIASPALYWIGGSGSWSEGSHWSASSSGNPCNCIPTQLDNVFFDAHSFNGYGQTINIDQEAICRSMNWTGARSSTTLAGNFQLNIYGSLTLNPHMNLAYNGSIYFKSNELGNTLMTYARLMPTTHFNGIDGEWVLQDNFTTLSTVYFEAGSLYTNNETLSAYEFRSIGSDTRSLTLGSSIINVSSSNSSSTWTTNGPNLTISSGTSTINLTGSNAYFMSDPFVFYDVNFSASSGMATLYSGYVFHNVTFSGDANFIISGTYNNLTLGSGKTANNNGTQTINGIFACDGTCGKPTILTGGTINKESGNVTVNYVRLQNSTATGGATFVANNALDLGNNNGWEINHSSPRNLFWIGNGGNWADAAHWSASSGGNSSNCIPTPYDNVFFDGNSFSTNGQIVNIDIEAYSNSMNWTGARSTSALAGGAIINIYGSLILNPQMDLTYYGTMNFKSREQGNILQTYGKTMPYLYFNGVGGEWILQDNLNSISDIYLLAGSLNTNNVTLNAQMFNTSGNSTRILTLGSSVINVSSSAGGPNYGAWITTGPNLNISSGTSTINLTGPGAYFSSDQFVYHDVNFTATSGMAILNSGFVFHDVSFSGNAAIYISGDYNSLILGTSKTTANNGTQVIHSTFTCNGTCAIPAKLTGGTLSKASGTVTINYVRLQNSTVTGGATFVANNALDIGNNVGWEINHSASKNLYWIGNGGNWSDAAHWSNSSGGASDGCIPTPYDNIYFDQHSFSTGSQSVNIDEDAYCKSMNWTGAQNYPTLAGGISLNIYGSLILNPQMDFTYGGYINFLSNELGNIVQTSDKTLPYTTFNGVGGEWILQDDFTTYSYIYFSAGSLNTNNVTINAFAFECTGDGTRSLTLGSSIINVSSSNGNYNYAAWITNGSNLIVSSGTSTINLTGPNAYFVSGPFIYNDVNFTNTTAAGTIYSGNVFHDVTFSDDAYINCPATFNNLTLGLSKTTNIYGTQTINGNLTCNGTCTIPAKLIGGTLNKAIGVVTINYVRLQNVEATGGATFIAIDGTDLGNNIGWTFSAGVSLDLYWIGNGGNWSDPNHWSTSSGGVSYGCIPRPVDNVFFDANSFTIGGEIVTIDQVAYCKTMNWTGVLSSTTLEMGPMNIYGSFILNPLMNITNSGTANFKSTEPGNTIQTCGLTMPYTIFDGIGGEWVLLDDFTTLSNIILSAGSLNTNNVEINAFSFNTSGGGSRSLSLGSSIINVSCPYGGYYSGAWAAFGPNLIISSGTSSINLSSPNAYFVTDPFIYSDVNFIAASGTATLYNGGSVFQNVTFSCNADIYSSGTYNNLNLGSSKTTSNHGTQTIIGALTCNGTCADPSALTGGTYNKESGDVTVNYVRLKNVTATGGATFVANDGTDLGDNMGWAFIIGASQNLYWIGDGGNWSDSYHWSTSSGGVTSGCIPRPNDNVFFDANSFTTGGQTVTIDQVAYCKSMNWTGALSSSMLSGSSQLYIYGSFILNPQMFTTYGGTLNFKSEEPGNVIQTFGLTMPYTAFDGVAGEWTLLDDFNTLNYIYLGAGSLNTNNVTINAYAFNTEGGGIRSLSLGSSVINLSCAYGNYNSGAWSAFGSNLTINTGTSIINLTSPAAYFTSNPYIYNDVNFTATTGTGSLYGWGSIFQDVTFTGNAYIGCDGTYNNLTLGISKTATISGIQIINGVFSCDGTCSIPATITGGTISKASGVVTANFISIQNASATGGASFIANNATDLGNNNGWSFNTGTPQNFYWVGDGGNWSDPMHWSNTSGGASSGCMPRPYDNVFFDANSFSTGGQTVNINQEAYCKSMNWSGAMSTSILAGSNPLNINGSLILNPQMYVTYNGTLNFKSNEPGNIIQTYGMPMPYTNFDGIGGEWILQDDFSTLSYINFVAGTLNTNNTTVNANAFSNTGYESCSLILGSSIVNVSGNYNAWYAVGSNLNIYPGTSTINLSGNNTFFYSNASSYHDVNFIGTSGTASLYGGGLFHDVTFYGDAYINNSGTYNNLVLN